MTEESEIQSIGEDELVRRICSSLPDAEQVLVGPGDDCAVIQGRDGPQLLKTDAIVAGVHFLEDEDPRRVGWKSVARVLSDFAAMGGKAGELLVTIAVPGTTSIKWIDSFYQGITSCLSRHGGTVVGGETTSLPEGAPKMISIAGRGILLEESWVTRSGGQIGDQLYVTGQLGGSLAGKHLDFNPRLKEAAWLCSNAAPRAMMDLSDGLAKDLPRLARASECGFELGLDTLPCNPGCDSKDAISDGEDYELLFAVPPESEFEDAWKREFPDLALTRIGELTEGPAPTLDGGWDHFANRDRQ